MKFLRALFQPRKHIVTVLMYGADDYIALLCIWRDLKFETDEAD